MDWRKFLSETEGRIGNLQKQAQGTMKGFAAMVRPPNAMGLWTRRPRSLWP